METGFIATATAALPASARFPGGNVESTGRDPGGRGTERGRLKRPRPLYGPIRRPRLALLLLLILLAFCAPAGASFSPSIVHPSVALRRSADLSCFLPCPVELFPPTRFPSKDFPNFLSFFVSATTY